eukprot:TRINITY_DN32422_c0_g1_i1.p1 TRINITY_DN32422_c0_g1~~TRINITY_DN32422_c0_g1_i1.p1  ORF type:complete len:1227 (+),score=363.49 TRINITY_DN32422_c0_g1_i1:67-3681(+)
MAGVRHVGAVLCLVASAVGPTYTRVTDLLYTDARRLALREETRRMFQHAWQGYLDHAWPADELRPLSCSKNDNFGGYALSVIDALDTLVVMANVTEFAAQVRWLTKSDIGKFHLLDRRVSVFETNIRVLGGLISAHMLAERLIPKQEYGGELLRMAEQLGEQLLPAFDTPTGVPYNEINLRKGVNHRAGHVTCPAASGTLILEFGVLGAITGECKYIEAAHRAMTGTWRFRSKHNLVGTILDIYTGKWTQSDSDIGASVDSFFEYMLKGYLIFDDDEWFEMWRVAKAAIEKHLHFPGNWYSRRNCATLQPNADMFVNSLQTFWPGLLVLDGDVEGAALAFRPWDCLFQRMGLVPEEYRVKSEAVGGPGYPLRPEMAESAWLLYRATKDPTYLRFGEELLQRINSTARTRCGYAAVKDVRTGKLEDKMDSYVLSETFKYLYMLFDPEPNPYIDMDKHVLTTEAHPIPIDAELRRRYHACKPFPDCQKDPRHARCQSGLQYSRRDPKLFKWKEEREQAEFESHVKDWERRGLCPKTPHPMKLAQLTRGAGGCLYSDLSKPRMLQNAHGGVPVPKTPPPQRNTKPKVVSFTVPKSQHSPAGADASDDEERRTIRVRVEHGTDVDVHYVGNAVVVTGLNTSLFRFGAESSAVSVLAPVEDGLTRWRRRKLLEWASESASARGAHHGRVLTEQGWDEGAARGAAARGFDAISERADESCERAATHACPAAVQDADAEVRRLLVQPPPPEEEEELRWHLAFSACASACAAAEAVVLEHATSFLRRSGVLKAAEPGALRRKNSAIRAGAHSILGKMSVLPRGDGADAGVWPQRRHLSRSEWERRAAASGGAVLAPGARVSLRSGLGPSGTGTVVAIEGYRCRIQFPGGESWAAPLTDVELEPDGGPPAPLMRVVSSSAVFGRLLNEGQHVTAKLQVVAGDGCDPMPAESARGNVVLLKRGGCSFHKKALNAETAGAAALVVWNLEGREPPELMGNAQGDAELRIPVAMVAYRDGLALEKIARVSGEGPTVELRGGGPLDNVDLHCLGLLVADTPAGLTIWNWKDDLPAAVAARTAAWNAASVAAEHLDTVDGVLSQKLPAIAHIGAETALQAAGMQYRRKGKALGGRVIGEGHFTLREAAAYVAGRKEVVDVDSLEWQGDRWPADAVHVIFRGGGDSSPAPPPSEDAHSYARRESGGERWGDELLKLRDAS